MSMEANIDVAVEPRYIEKESVPEEGRYVFAYTITISNLGSAPATLRSRHWLITDANGDQQEVRGAGVVGEEPCIEPHSGFRYTSAAVIATAVGTMQGSYRFEAQDGEFFDVPIEVFTLQVPNVVH
jgi:ApaG protein